MELANVRRLQLGQDRFGYTYWLLGTSQLPVATDRCPTAAGDSSDAGAAAAAAAGDAAAAGEAAPESAAAGSSGKAGSGGKGSKVRSGVEGTYGCVFVHAPAEDMLPSMVAAAAGAAAGGGSHKPGLPPPGPVNAAAAAALAAAAPGSAAPGAAAVAAAGGPAALGPLRSMGHPDLSEQQPPQHQMLLLPALPATTAAAAGHQAANGVLRGKQAAGSRQEQQQQWGAFTSLAQLDAVLDWLNPQGTREGPLKAALQRVRDNMLLFAPVTSQQAAAAGAEQQAFSSRAGTPAITTAAAAAAAPKQPASSQLKGGSSAAVQQQWEPAAVADLQQQLVAAAAANDDAAAADALRDGLSRFMSGLPEASMHSFWGSSSRCEVWTAALAAAQQPRDFAALIAQLELMLLTDSWRMGWQLWAHPAQNPELVHTWPQVGFWAGSCAAVLLLPSYLDKTYVCLACSWGSCSRPCAHHNAFWVSHRL